VRADAIKRLVGDRPYWAPHPGPQTKVLAVGNVFEILYGGARGGGKTDAGIAWLLKAPHFGNPRYRALVLRQSYKDLRDWIDRASRIYAWYGGRRIGEEFRFQNGAVFSLGYLKDRKSFEKYQGHEYQKVLIEEAGQIPDEKMYLMLLGSCRSTVEGLAPRILLTANPGGAGHGWLKARFGCGKGSGHEPGRAFRGEDGELRMYIPATVEDNPTLLKTDPRYVAYLNALPEPLRSAWRNGDWDVYMGQAFSWSGENIITPQPVPEDARIIMAYDWGFGKPFSVGWWWVAGDCLIRIDELYGCVPGQADTGLRLSDVEVARRIIEREQEMGWKPYRRLCDPTCFNKKPDMIGGGQGDSTATVFLRAGLTLSPGDPSRKLKFRQFAMRVETKTLKVFSTCKEFIRTVPNLPMNEHTWDDVDTTAEDHIYDEACHPCMEVPLPAAVLEAQFGREAKPAAEAEPETGAYANLGDLLKRTRRRK